MLEALEEENFKILPNKAYIRGFVKSYVKAVGGKQKEAIQILEETHRYYFPEEYVTSEEEEEVLQSSAPSVNIVKATLLVLGILAIVAIGFFLSSSTEKTPKKAQQEESPSVPAKEQEEEDVSPARISSKTPLKTVTPSPSTKKKKDEDPAPVSTPKEEVAQKKKTEKEQKDKQKDKKEEEITLRPLPRDLYQYADVDHQEQVKKYIPDQMQTVIPNKENLFIRATNGDTWLAYKADDQDIRRFTLREGKFTLIRANTIRIFFGNVNATKVFLNNKLLKTPSRTGVKSLVIPEEKSDQFMLPLFIFKEDGTAMTSEEYQKKNP